MASWFDDLLGAASKVNTESLFNLGVGAGIDYFGGDDPQIAMAGYQGSIPEYDMLLGVLHIVAYMVN